MWANWWNVYSKIWVKSNVLSYPDVCLEISFFDTSIWGAIAPHSLHLPGQTKLFPPSQSKGLWTKERDDIRLQITKHYWAGISRFILILLLKSDEKGPAWNHGKYPRIAKSWFSYRLFLSNAPTAHHNITWHLGISDEHSVWAAMASPPQSEDCVFDCSAEY